MPQFGVQSGPYPLKAAAYQYARKEELFHQATSVSVVAIGDTKRDSNDARNHYRTADP